MCDLVEDPGNSKAVKERLSTTYGINRQSVLFHVQHFDVCKCFPEDAMHVLLEGLVPYETKLLLKVLIGEKVVTLQELNNRLESFDYGYMDKKDKPTLISRDTMNSSDFKLKQSGNCENCIVILMYNTCSS